MNYQNIPFSYLQTPYFYETPFYQYSYFPYYFKHSAQPHNFQSSQIIPQETILDKTLNQHCFAQIQQKLRKMHASSNQRRKNHWSVNQDKLLQRLVEIQKLQWRELPKYFENRTQNMCYSRYRRIYMGAKASNWSKDEEEHIVELVQKYGEKWTLISSKISKYSPKQIREKYINCLRPNIFKQDFTFQEDIKICKFILEHGKHWKKMEQFLPGRTNSHIKRRFYGKLHKIIQDVIGDKSY